MTFLREQRRYRLAREERRHLALLLLDAHGVERTPDEGYRDGQEQSRESMRESGTLIARKRNCELHREQSKQRRELDDRIERHRRRVLERIADSITNDSRCVQISSFLLELHLDNLLRVVPCTTCICHEDGLIQSEDCNRY